MLESFIIKYTSILPNFILIVLTIQFKRNKQKCNFHFVAMPMMRSPILKFLNFTKARKSRYLENKALFFLQIGNSLITHQGLLFGKKYFCSRER